MTGISQSDQKRELDILFKNLKKARIYTDQSFKSKYNDKSYRLIDFEWKPYKEADKNQGNLL